QDDRDRCRRHLTTNITGFFTWMRGSNFHSESTSARETISRSKRERDLLSAMKNVLPQKSLPAYRARCSTIGPSASAGEKSNAATIKITPTSSATNRPPGGGKVPPPTPPHFLSTT